MSESLNNCFWFGLESTSIRQVVEEAGFRFQAFPELSGDCAGLDQAGFVFLNAQGLSRDSVIKFLESCSSTEQHVCIWVTSDTEEEWSNLVADRGFVCSHERHVKPIASFVAKSLNERRQHEEMDEQHSRALDDLQVSIESHEVASKRFEALFNGLPVACFTFDASGIIHEWNALSTEVFQLEAYETFYQTVWDTLDPETRGGWSPEIVQSIFDQRESMEFDWSYVRADGTEVHLACKVLCLTNRLGQVIAAVAGNLDITERVLAQRKVDEQVREIKSYLKTMERQRVKLQDANRQLRLLAVTDGLTGLMNRRRFNEQLDEALDRAIRQNGKFSLLLFDIDHFKQLNDVFGHQAGDEILVKFAGVIRDTARRYERPARYGGEEFAIILDNCDENAAVMVAERFRMAIANFDWPFRAITASVGCSTFTGTQTARGMIETADEALYDAKRSGRNRVVHNSQIAKTDSAA